jgi:hypothetical protein
MEDFELEQELIQNRMRRFGQQGYQEPQGQMVGNQFVAPNVLQHLAAGLRGYGAIKGQAGAEQELKDLRGKRREAETRDMSAFVDLLRPKPAVASTTTPTQMPSFDEADAQSMQGVQGYGATTGAQAAIPGDPMAAYSLAAASQSPTLRQVGMKGIAETSQRQADLARQQQQLQVLKNAENPQAAIAAGVDPALVKNYYESQNIGKEKGVVVNGQLVNPVTGAPIGQAIPKQATPTQPNLASDLLIPDGKGGFIPNAALINAKSQVAAAGRAPAAAQSPYFQPVQTAQGVMAFNARTGRVEPVMGANGQPVVGAAADPALQGQLAGAKTTGAKEAEGRIDARGESRKADMFLQQLTQAENILKQGPTASGVGAVVDAAGRLVGQSTPGAQRAGQLESLSGWLVANVPRMEGPQSNFDVQNYMTMAGKIGDRTVPVKERLAALDQVRELQKKYKTSADARMGNAPPTATPQKTVVRTGTANGRKVVQYSDGTTAYAD